MITDKGVRAGMNPAPTNSPLQTTFKIGDNSPQFSVKGDNVFLSICIFVPSITLSPANLDFWPIPNVEPQHDGDDETND